MAIEKKTGLFYELMIRGRWDPSRGELGEVETYQLQTGTAIIDTDSNTLAAPYQPDPARDLTKEEAVAFLDEKFSDFLGQIDVERSRAGAAEQRTGDAEKNLAATERHLAAALSEVDALRKKLTAVVEALNAA